MSKATGKTGAGNFFEDFVVGQAFKHATPRTLTEADAALLATLAPDRVVLATGARPYAGALDLGDVPVLEAWDVLAGARPSGRVLVADWGGDPTGLDTAELLASEGREVTLVTAAPMPGFSVHQYARHQYLARLERA